MSYDQEYFPPKGTKWKWGEKVLNYSPWACNLAPQKEAGLSLWPLSILLYVDKVEDHWTWSVRIIDFQHKRTTLTGTSPDPLGACLAAEEAGEQALSDLLPEWVRTALKNKWRPPVQE